MMKVKAYVAIFLWVIGLLTGCGEAGFSKQEKARNLVHEWNAQALDEAGYASNGFGDLEAAEYKGKPALKITHRFNYGNKGRLREYDYFLDTAATRVLGRKRTAWDKENQP